MLVQFMIRQAWADRTLWMASPSEVYLCNFMPSADFRAAYQTARSCKVCASETWAAWGMFFWPVSTYLKRKDNQLYIWLWQRLAKLGDVGDLKDWTVRSPVERANSARQSVMSLSARLCTGLLSQMPDQGPSSKLWCATCANPSSWFCGGQFWCSILFEKIWRKPAHCHNIGPCFAWLGYSSKHVRRTHRPLGYCTQLLKHRQSPPQKRPGISMRLSCPEWIRNTGFIQAETGPRCCNSVAALSVRTSPLNPWWTGWWVMLQSRCLNFQRGRACFVLKRTLCWEAVALMTHELCLCSKVKNPPCYVPYLKIPDIQRG